MEQTLINKWFVWMKGQRGSFPQIWHTVLTNGDGKPTAQALFVHKLEPDELHLDLDRLAEKFKDRKDG